MSRSFKKPIIKDKGLTRGEYWQRVRSNWNQLVKKYRWTGFDYSDSSFEEELEDRQYVDYLKNIAKDELIFENQRSIVNDYDKSDYKFILTKNDKNYFEKAKRK